MGKAWRVCLAALLFVGMIGTVSAQSIDGFEDNDLTEYTKDSVFSTSSDSFEGSYALKATTDGGQYYASSTSGLDTYPNRGETIEYYIKGNDIKHAGFMFGKQSEDTSFGSAYMVDVNFPENEVRVYKDGFGTQLGSKSISLSSSTWYRVKIDWKTNHDINVSVYDKNLNFKDSFVVTDSSYDSGGIGFHTNTDGGTYGTGTMYIDSINNDFNSPPSFDSVSTTPSNWTVGESTDFNYNVSDSDGNVSNVTLEVFNSSSGDKFKNETFQYSSSTVVDTQTEWYTPQNQGNYTLYFTAKDYQGAETVETLSKTAQPAPDTTPPDITIHKPMQNTFYDASVPLEVSANKSVTDWQYTINGGSNNTFTPNTSLSLNTGNKDLTVYATDQAGNIGSQTVNFDVDATKPNVNYDCNTTSACLTSTEYPVYNQNWIYTFVSVSDSESGIANATQNFDGNKDTVFSNSFSKNYTNLNDGIYYINTTAFDNVANFANEPINVNQGFVELDTTKPNITIESPLNQLYSSNDILLNVTSNEGALGWEYNLDGNGYTNFGDPTIVNTGVTQKNTTLNNLDAGNHILDVRVTDDAGNSKVKTVSFDVEGITGSQVNSPLDGDSYSYLDTSSGVNVEFNGDIETSFSGTLDVLVNGSSIYSKSISSGSNSYSYSQEFTQGTYDTTLQATSSSSGNTYTTNTNLFTVNEVANPPPVINKTVYKENVTQDDKVNFNVFGSDYTQRLDNYNFKVVYNSSTVETTSGSLSSTTRWINVTDLFTAEKPGTYTIQAKLKDNNDITTIENFNVNVEEGNVDFNLKEPNDTVETGGAINYNTSFRYDVDLPSNGLVTLYISEPGQSDFVADGSESLQGITYTGREIVKEFNNISYSNIAGEDYRASGTYDWYFEYESSPSGNVYTSSVKSWQFIDTPETTDTTDKEDDGGLFAGLMNTIILVLVGFLLFVPIWIKFKVMD